MDSKLFLFLKELKQYGVAHDVPNISLEFGQFLNAYIRLSEKRNILEIGCANGYSTIWLAEALNFTNGKMVAVDFSAPSLAQAVENVKKCGLQDRVHFIEGNGIKVIPTLNQNFDLIFIDGQIKAYTQLFEAAKTVLADGGVIILDNVRKFPHKIEDFWKYIEHQKEFAYMETPMGEDAFLMMWKKP